MEPDPGGPGNFPGSFYLRHPSPLQWSQTPEGLETGIEEIGAKFKEAVLQWSQTPEGLETRTRSVGTA